MRLTRRALVGRAALAWAATSTGCAGVDRPRAASPEIVVERADDLIDAPWSIHLRGFPPTSRVEVTATLAGWGRAPWRSWASFETDTAGEASLASTPSLGGSYRGVSPMGLFWSMERQAEESAVPAAPVTGAFPLTLTAVARDGSSAAITLERRLASAGVTRRDLTDGPAIGTLFTPASPGPHPTVVVLAGSGGGVLLAPAALLASRGYAALALGYFRMPGLPQGLVNIPLEYFETAIDWLRETLRPRADFIGVIGWSRGGELALLLGASIPEVSAVVAYVPSGVLFGPLGPSEPADRRPRAAWMHRGTPLPHLAENNRAMTSVVDQRRSPVVETPAYLTLLRDRDAVERATIPVERTRGPVLLISGKDDDQWPSFELAQIAYRRLQGHRHPYPFAHLAYEGAGHLVTFPYTPTSMTSYVHPANGLTYSFGGHPAMTAAANADSWAKVLAFLRDAQTRR